MDNLVIRPVTNKDLGQLKKLYRTTIRNDFGEYSKKVINHFVSYSYWKQMAGVKHKVGVFMRGKMVGYLLAPKPEGGVINIYWMAVGQDYRGKGIGQTLLSYFEKYAKKMGVHNIHLESKKENVAFYKKCGYRLIGLDEKGYYGTDNYIMKKMIAEPTEENVLK